MKKLNQSLFPSLLIMLTLTACSGPTVTHKVMPTTSSPSPIDSKVKEPVSSASAKSFGELKPKESEVDKAVTKKDKHVKAAKPSTTVPDKAEFALDHYSLLGITIGDEQSKVIRYLKEPESIYEPDASSVEEVNEYDGFIVAYHSNHRVARINIFDAAIDPLLLGIRVGSQVNEVYEKLGRPQRANEVQIEYIQSKYNIALKMDIDSKTLTINAISLYQMKE